MARKKKTDTSWLDSKFATCKDARIVESYYQCEEIMKKNGWSWTTEDGRPLHPIDMFEMIDRVCNELAKEYE